jgi:ribosome-associated protein
MEALSINDWIQIPLAEFEFSFARSGGPGGQNVNKVNSKAIMHWNVTQSPSLPEGVRQRFLTKYATRLTSEGVLVLSGQKYRDQIKNTEDCLSKLQEMVLSVAVPPTPRRPTKPTFSSKKRRAESKSQASQKKAQRQRPRLDD